MIPRNLTAMVQMGLVTTGGGPPESLDSSSQQFPWAHLALVGWPFALTSLAVIGRSIKGAILRWDRMARWENVMRQDILFVSRNANKIWIFKKKQIWRTNHHVGGLNTQTHRVSSCLSCNWVQQVQDFRLTSWPDLRHLAPPVLLKLHISPAIPIPFCSWNHVMAPNSFGGSRQRCVEHALNGFNVWTYPTKKCTKWLGIQTPKRKCNELTWRDIFQNTGIKSCHENDLP